MANNKNTIQNIPLTGPLCLNTLKTDVAQFEGYNEKNTTVFGGELTPIRSKETELGSKDSTYTIFNSKGEPFTINLIDHSISSNGDVVGHFNVPIELEDCAPKDAYWYKFFIIGPFPNRIKGIIGQVYLDNSGTLWGRFVREKRTNALKDYETISSLLSCQWTKLTEIGQYQFTGINVKASDYGDYTAYPDGPHFHLCFSAIGETQDNSKKYLFYYLYDQDVTSAQTFNDLFNPDKSYFESGDLPSSFTSSSFSTGSLSYLSPTSIVGNVSFVPFMGKKVLDRTERCKELKFSISDDVVTTTVTDTRLYVNDFDVYEIGGKTSEIYPDAAYNLVVTPDNYTGISFLYGSRSYLTGHDGNFFIPGIKRAYPASYLSRVVNVNYLDGSLYSVSLCGRLVRQPGVINYSFFSNDGQAVSFKDTDDKWHTIIVVGKQTRFDNELYKKIFLKSGILDNRYIFYGAATEFNDQDTSGFYDIESKKFIPTVLDYVDNLIPVIAHPDITHQITKLSGIIYASGFNVNYPISRNPFTGNLANPKLMIGFPSEIDNVGVLKEIHFFPGRQNGIDVFYSIGDNVQSAEYHGNNPEYDGTVYPIDSNGNIIYPITWGSKVLNGYSNNDFIKEGKTAYPLIYWNNNQKMYAYYLLSSMENVEGAFSLQGQQYTFDDNNIYNVQFTNGVIQGVNSVCYKKNMMFLGTLPKAAIFYSRFNKTFYQFTGDAILSKMFEASDINEIKFVGQNPSSLSLWICTDNGVYIMSDTDMFKVDYDVKDIYFEETKAILVTENETNWVENDISLYDIGDDAVETPIKLHTKFYGIGAEQKVTYDCWYIRLHNKDHKAGKLKLKVNTITNTSFETEEKTYDIEPSMYDGNDTIFIRYQPKYQSAVATQLELESDIAIYQISLGVNTTDAVAQQSKFSF